MDLTNPIVWVHEEALGPANPALQDHPKAPALFVFDQTWIEAQRISRKRLGFLYECALELPLTLRKGDVVEEVLAFAQRHGADGVMEVWASVWIRPLVEKGGDDARHPRLDRHIQELLLFLLAHPRAGGGIAPHRQGWDFLTIS